MTLLGEQEQRGIQGCYPSFPAPTLPHKGTSIPGVALGRWVYFTSVALQCSVTTPRATDSDQDDLVYSFHPAGTPLQRFLSSEREESLFAVRFVLTKRNSEMRNLITRKGKKVATPYTDEEAMTRLRAVETKSDFAKSLLSHRNLSPDQMTWVHVLVVGNNQPAKSEIVEGLNLLSIVELMTKASWAFKRWPKIVLQGMVLLRKPNAEILVRNASKQRIAVIDRDGAVHRGTINNAQLWILADLDLDPERVAAQHGVATFLPLRVIGFISRA